MMSVSRQPPDKSGAATATEDPSVRLPPARRRMAAAALVIYDICLVILIIGVPLTMAGIREFGVAAILGCALLMGITWSLRQVLGVSHEYRFSGLELILCGAILLVGLQLAELPDSVLSVVSPFAHQTLNAAADMPAASEGPLQAWRTISMTPDRTWSGLLQLLALSVIVLTLLQRLATAADVDRVLKLSAVSVTVMSVIGLGQLFVGNGQFLWLFEHPYRTAAFPARGTFPNENHFAHFLVLGIGPLVWWWNNLELSLRRNRRRLPGRGSSALQNGVAAAMAAVLFAALLSFSRGGLAVLTAVLMLTFAAFASQRQLLLRLTLPVLLFAALGVMMFGSDSLMNEWDSVLSAESVSTLIGGRQPLWEADLAAVTQFWPAGSGLGSHADVYPLWLSSTSHLRFSHAECGYLEVLLELGIPGFLLLVAALSLAARWCWLTWRGSRSDNRYRVAAIAISLLASGLHSLVDFVWYIPACLLMTVILAVCACRCFQLSRVSSPVRSLATMRPGPVAGWIALCGLIPAAVILSSEITASTSAAEHWHTWVRLSSQSAREADFGLTHSLDDQLDRLIAEMEACLAIRPHDPQALSNLGPLYLRRGELRMQQSQNAMSLAQVRGAAGDAGFHSADELRQWFDRVWPDAAGDFDRARQVAAESVRARPLRAEALIVLAELGFLEQQSADQRLALVRRAVSLRPNCPEILTLAAHAFLECDDEASAFRHWQHACRISPKVEQQIIGELSPHFTAEHLATRLSLPPSGLMTLFDACRRTGRGDQQQAAALIFAEQFSRESGHTATAEPGYWSRAADVFAFLNQTDRVIACLKEAVRSDAAGYAVRTRLARALIDAHRFDEAFRQLEWCHIRHPDDAATMELMRLIELQRDSDTPRRPLSVTPASLQLRDRAGFRSEETVTLPPATAQD